MTGRAAGRAERRPGSRPARPVTADALERAAIFYLERYAAPAAQVRRVLLRRIERRCREDGSDPAALRPLVDEAVVRLVARGLIDDRAYAEGAARSLRRRGASARRARTALMRKGVERELAERAVPLSDEAERDAAIAFARRRRLGPFRAATERAARRDRDLAALARQGFGLDVARAVIEGDSE